MRPANQSFSISFLFAMGSPTGPSVLEPRQCGQPTVLEWSWLHTCTAQRLPSVLVSLPLHPAALLSHILARHRLSGVASSLLAWCTFNACRKWAANKQTRAHPCVQKGRHIAFRTSWIWTTYCTRNYCLSTFPPFLSSAPAPLATRPLITFTIDFLPAPRPQATHCLNSLEL